MFVSLQDYGHQAIKENTLRFSRVLSIPLANYYLFSIYETKTYNVMQWKQISSVYNILWNIIISVDLHCPLVAISPSYRKHVC